MKRTYNLLTPLLTLAACAALTLGVASQTQAADATGNWTWTRPGRNGGEAQKLTLSLKADGEKLTGSLTNPGRQGGAPVKTEISDGKVKGDEISFSVTREVNANKMTTKYLVRSAQTRSRARRNPNATASRSRAIGKPSAK